MTKAKHFDLSDALVHGHQKHSRRSFRTEKLVIFIRSGFLNYATYATYATQDLALRTLRS